MQTRKKSREWWRLGEEMWYNNYKSVILGWRSSPWAQLFQCAVKPQTQSVWDIPATTMGGAGTKLKMRFAGIVAFGISIVILSIAVLCMVSTPADGSLFRSGLPTVEDVKDSVKDDEYEKIEDKTNLIKEYIRVLLDNLF